MRHRPLAVSIVLVGVAAFVGIAGAAHVCQASKPGTSAAFERLKSLAGTWSGTGCHGETQVPATVTYKVTSGGTAVLETLFPGTEKEMLTIYYLDGEDLVLTHYCGLGNQPRMKAAVQADGKLVFSFAGGSNIASDKEHMHDLVMDLVSNDELRTEWHLFADGKQVMASKFSLKRS